MALYLSPPFAKHSGQRHLIMKILILLFPVSLSKRRVYMYMTLKNDTFTLIYMLNKCLDSKFTRWTTVLLLHYFWDKCLSLHMPPQNDIFLAQSNWYKQERSCCSESESKFKTWKINRTSYLKGNCFSHGG